MIISPDYIYRKNIVRSKTGPPIDAEKQLQPNGIDVRLLWASEISGNFTLSSEETDHCENVPQSPDAKGYITFESGKAYAISCVEFVDIPENMGAMVYGRSTLNRNGIFARSSLYDSGFKNRIGLTMFFFANAKIQIHSRIAQIVFTTADSHGLYSGQYGVNENDLQE